MAVDHRVDRRVARGESGAGSGADRHRDRRNGRCSAWRDRSRRARSHRQYLRIRHRCERHLSSRRPRGDVSGDRPAVGLPDRDANQRPAPARAAGQRESRAGAGDAPGNGHGDRRSSAHRDGVDDHQRQHRPAPDGGAPDQRPQLDGPGAADAGSAPQRVGRIRPEPPGLLADHRRWPAGHDDLPLRRRQRAAAVEPRCDRGVRRRREPVRRHAGALGRHDRERDHQVGHQRFLRHGRRLLPERQVQRGGFRRRPCSAVLEPADERHVRRPDHPRPAAFLRRLRIRARAEDVRLRDTVPGVQHGPGVHRPRAQAAGADRLSRSPRRPASRRACRGPTTGSTRAAARPIIR